MQQTAPAQKKDKGTTDRTCMKLQFFLLDVEAISGWFTMNDPPESKYAIQDIQD